MDLLKLGKSDLTIASLKVWVHGRGIEDWNLMPSTRPLISLLPSLASRRPTHALDSPEWRPAGTIPSPGHGSKWRQRCARNQHERSQARIESPPHKRYLPLWRAHRASRRFRIAARGTVLPFRRSSSIFQVA